MAGSCYLFLGLSKLAEKPLAAAADAVTGKKSSVGVGLDDSG